MWPSVRSSGEGEAFDLCEGRQAGSLVAWSNVVTSFRERLICRLASGKLLVSLWEAPGKLVVSLIVLFGSLEFLLKY